MTEFKIENDVDDSEDTDDDQKNRGEDYVANQQKLRHEVNVIRNKLTKIQIEGKVPTKRQQLERVKKMVKFPAIPNTNFRRNEF